MATYAIGDIQGCYQTLQKLLKHIRFNPQQDQLWLAGDLINRGPDSLKTLEYVYQHKESIRCVLGNHDLHYLAVESGQHQATKKDSFDQLLNSPNRLELSQWLIKQPLMHFDQSLNFAMAHAGIYPGWSIEQALLLSSEVSKYLQSDNKKTFFQQMYGNLPTTWRDALSGIDRLRFITNAFTRMRYCYVDGALELTQKGTPGKQPVELFPWFELSANQIDCELIFGHWASLDGHCDKPNLHALDTGCVWGGKLTALRLEDKKLFSCDSIEI